MSTAPLEAATRLAWPEAALSTAGLALTRRPAASVRHDELRGRRRRSVLIGGGYGNAIGVVKT
jgi:hypothetical protein